MPFEQTTDKLKDKVPQIDGENAKVTAFGIFESLKPMLSFVLHFMIDLFKEMFKIFSNAFRRKYD